MIRERLRRRRFRRILLDRGFRREHIDGTWSWQEVWKNGHWRVVLSFLDGGDTEAEIAEGPYVTLVYNDHAEFVNALDRPATVLAA